MYMMYLPYKPLNFPHFSKINYHIEKISSIQKILKSSKVGCFMCTKYDKRTHYLFIVTKNSMVHTASTLS